MAYYGGDPYNRPPPPGYGQPPYGQPYNQGPPGPPLARPPPGPPPPLPPGWYQQWEPNAQRAFWVEEATGRSQWEAPYGYGFAGDRGGPPPAGYYNQGPPPAPYGGGGGYDNYPPQQAPQEQQSSSGSGVGKMVMAGIGGAALGAFVTHEIDEHNESEEEREAYEEGREDQAFDDDGGW
ncbi:hypothetical protein N7493_005924 [Penicillium malachiteum]|uniref:WW domain-containing protein n=1 Tax=Penicillium malachiteum TaxID=1324776 RepID=A0AAD6MW22_9EURO|nr:hypothetical protein N7493_005924 [Penicillium malachiteum]